MFIPWTWSNVFYNPWRVISHLSSVDDDVIRFIWEMTENRWCYRYHSMKRFLLIFDRIIDIAFVGLFVLYYCELFPHWPLCLYVYVFCRVISFVLYSNTKVFKCYAVRTVLSTIFSGLLCSLALWVPMILAWSGQALVIVPVCYLLVMCAAYVLVFMETYRKLKIVNGEDFDFVFELEDDRWLYRYYGMRRLMMFLDRLFDVFVFGLFAFYHLKSIAYWPICLGIYILLRLMSFELHFDSKIFKCYAIRTVLPLNLSLCCSLTLWAPMILAWRGEALVIVPVCGFLAMCAIYLLVFKVFCRKFY